MGRKEKSIEVLMEKRFVMASGKKASCSILRWKSHRMGSVNRYHTLHLSNTLFIMRSRPLCSLWLSCASFDNLDFERWIMHFANYLFYIAYPNSVDENCVTSFLSATIHLLCNPHGGHTALNGQRLLKEE